jgi:hypothetical protein
MMDTRFKAKAMLRCEAAIAAIKKATGKCRKPAAS